MGTPVVLPLDTEKLDDVPRPPEGSPAELVAAPEGRLLEPVGTPVGLLSVAPDERGCGIVDRGLPVSG